MSEGSTKIEDIFDPIILEAMNPNLKWEKNKPNGVWGKECIGTHYEDVDCDCEPYDDCMCSGFVPDKDAIWLDWWIPYPKTIFDLLPKTEWKSLNKL